MRISHGQRDPVPAADCDLQDNGADRAAVADCSGAFPVPAAGCRRGKTSAAPCQKRKQAFAVKPEDALVLLEMEKEAPAN